MTEFGIQLIGITSCARLCTHGSDRSWFGSNRKSYLTNWTILILI